MSGWTQIVVGVDGSPASYAAVRFAASEAVRTGAPLTLIHVIPGIQPVLAAVDPLYPLNRADLRHEGRKILDEAVRIAASAGARGAKGLIADGDRVKALQTKAVAGSLLVIGDERPSLPERLATGSVLHAVASRSPGTVVVVPEHWDAGPAKGRVAVGVEDVDGSDGLLWRAFQAANERHSDLLILHAWEFRIRYGHVRVEEEQIATWRGQVLSALSTSLAACHAEFPDVAYELTVRDAQPAKALVDTSTGADLLVLARQTHALMRPHLGATGKAVLQAAACPVEVVPPAATPIWERGAAIENRGEMLAR